MDFSTKVATYIGLNEAVFLTHIHQLVQPAIHPTNNLNASVLNASGVKLIDDTPWICRTLDQLMTEFPFWDKSQIKRIIKNVRNDGLLRSRYDLNEDPKDNSVWHTINYTELSQLNGKVERLLKKNAKRRKARAQRQVDKQPGYIYFCRTDEPGVKIGSTQDVDRRMRQLDADLLLFLNVLNMAEAENWLHDYLKPRHIANEQFDLLTVEDVMLVANHLIDSDEIELPEHVLRH